jgi:hypothetical protein
VGAGAGFVAISDAVSIAVGVGCVGSRVVVMDEGPDIADSVGGVARAAVENGVSLRCDAEAAGGEREEREERTGNANDVATGG